MGWLDGLGADTTAEAFEQIALLDCSVKFWFTGQTNPAAASNWNNRIVKHKAWKLVNPCVLVRKWRVKAAHHLTHEGVGFAWRSVSLAPHQVTSTQTALNAGSFGHIKAANGCKSEHRQKRLNKKSGNNNLAGHSFIREISHAISFKPPGKLHKILMFVKIEIILY